MNLMSFLLHTLLPILLTTIITFILSEPIRLYYGYFIHVIRNARRLSMHMKHLEGRMKDLPHGVHAVEVWVNEMNSLKKEVDNFERDYKRWKTAGDLLSKWGRARYEIAKRAGDLLERADLLAKINVDIGRLPPPPAIQKRDASNLVLGLESSLEEALGHLELESTLSSPAHLDLPVPGPRVIGIFGMGEVGKTTLLKQINNHLAFTPAKNVFDHVVWATVSQKVNLVKLQEDIAQDLGLPLPSSHSIQQRANVIRNYMNDKHFLLLLDDLWDHLELEELGIPNPQEGGSNLRRKVVFTTRFEKVCDFMQVMDAHKKRIKVPCLSPNHAWQLFQKMLGENYFNNSVHELRNLARATAEQCGGLPLALKTIGAAMSSRKSLEDWEDALESLKESQPISGMEESIFRVLKHSYDYLNDDRMRECFLCCAMWPEDYSINKDELLQCWMGLGLLDRHRVDEKYRVGREYIQALKAACLLEDGANEDREVKMHDVLRDMALQIAYDRHKWMVRAGVGLEEAPRDMEQWAATERVSLMFNRIMNLTIFDREECWMEGALILTKLSALMLGHNELLKIPNSFFSCMLNLTYLDLSSNHSLQELPCEICDLTGLQYLNLSHTDIRSLPQEMGRLEKLRYLFLSHTTSLISQVTPKVIPRALQVLDLFYSSVEWEAQGEITLLGLKSLEILGITMRSTRMLQMLSKLSLVELRRIRIENIDSPTSLVINRSFRDLGHVRNHLQTLEIYRVSNMKELKVDFGEDGSRGIAWNLRKLELLNLVALPDLEKIVWRGVKAQDFLPRLRSLWIGCCIKLETVSWVLRLRCLEELTVYLCHKMKMLIDENEVRESTTDLSFPRLKELDLSRLPSLEGIYCSGLAFPSLETIFVRACPKLRSLPFQWPLTDTKMKRIQGHQDWWDGLQWEDERIKISLQKHFVLG